MMENFLEAILQKAEEIKNLAGKQVQVLGDKQIGSIANEYSISFGQVCTRAMELGILPLRYLRNAEVITIQDQLRLARSCVTIIGAGGLGGNVILTLARLGIGQIKIVDGDSFDETNLNRQILCISETIGKNKAEVAKEIILKINPAVHVKPYPIHLTPENAHELLKGSDVVVDALDNVEARFIAQEAAQKLRIPFVHGALAGFEGQIMTILPGDTGLSMVYGKQGHNSEQTRGAEAILGVPSVTATMVATLQSMEVLKLLLGKRGIFHKQLVHIDLELGRISSFSLE